MISMIAVATSALMGEPCRRLNALASCPPSEAAGVAMLHDTRHSTWHDRFRPSEETQMRFRTTLLQSGPTATGFEVPPEVVETLGGGKRPPVRVTINGHTYRNTVAVMGGVYMIGVSAENRAAAGVKGGDELDVDIELDTAPREVSVPDDLNAALDVVPEARATFDGLSYSNKSWHVLQVTGAKTEETRARRIAKSVEALREGRVR